MARRHGHSTSKQAADVAQEAGVKRLVLTHISARYVGPLVAQLAQEARAVHPNSYVAKDFYEEKLSKKNIVITGASGDIAQALVQRLEDHNLILISRSLPQPVMPEKVDILINNAGFGEFTELSNLSDEQIDEMFKVNTLDLIKRTRDLQPQLQVINIASIAGKLPTAKSTVYAASKAAVLAFSDALRLEKPDLIVTTVNTGPVRTKFHKDNMDYLEKVGENAVSAEYVADKIEQVLGKNKRELNLPVQLAFVAKVRALFPSLVDNIGNRFLIINKSSNKQSKWRKLD